MLLNSVLSFAFNLFPVHHLKLLTESLEQACEPVNTLNEEKLVMYFLEDLVH
jgi:hypothetical protein